MVGRLILPPCRLSPLGRLRLRNLRSRGVKWGSRCLEMRMKCPWSSRTSMFPLSCAFLANARGEPLQNFRAILDSGAHFTNLSLPIVEMMERTFPGVQMGVSFSLGAR